MERIPGSKPLYAQIVDDIRKRIEAGEWAPGQKFPTERELQEYYRVSRTCVRQAIANLRADGFLHCVQGRGTFVCNVTPVDGWRRLSTFEAQYRSKWATIGARLLELTEAEIPEPAVGFLGASSGERVLLIKRLRLLEGEPVVLLHHYVAPWIPKDVFLKEPHFVSFTRLLESRLGIVVGSAREVVTAIACRGDDAKILRTKARTPVLRVQRWARERTGRPVEYVEMVVRSDMWTYEVELNH